MAEVLQAGPATTGDQIKALEGLVSEAYQEIDKAVGKGILHKNNGARKKSRVARYKRIVLMASGLWTPPADHPDYGRWQKMQKKVAA
jgi:small subunit ribosomal protein S20